MAFAEGKSVEGAESAEQSKATLRVGKYSFASNLAPFVRELSALLTEGFLFKLMTLLTTAPFFNSEPKESIRQQSLLMNIQFIIQHIEINVCS